MLELLNYIKLLKARHSRDAELSLRERRREVEKREGGVKF